MPVEIVVIEILEQEHFKFPIVEEKIKIPAQKKRKVV